MSIKDGGPLHPFQPLDSQGMPCMAAEPGISIRDYFAGLAMLGWRDTSRIIDEDAADAYRMADAMIRAREASQ